LIGRSVESSPETPEAESLVVDIRNDDSAFAELGHRAVIGSMQTQLDESPGARDQIGRLLRVIVGLASDLDMDGTLHRIVNAAMELTGAGYGALGVLGPDGTLISFLDSGLDEATVARIGHLPVGKGVLGVLLDEPQPLRLARSGRPPGGRRISRTSPVVASRRFGQLDLTRRVRFKMAAPQGD
jgi:hypothetical protein